MHVFTFREKKRSKVTSGWSTSGLLVIGHYRLTTKKSENSNRIDQKNGQQIRSTRIAVLFLIDTFVTFDLLFIKHIKTG